MVKKTIICLLIFFTAVGCTNNTNNNESKPVTKNENNIKSAKDWQESAIFESNGYQMIGEEGRLGLIYDDDETMRFYPNKENKYMWHFWGSDEELEGELKIVGIHEDGKERVTVLEGESLGGANNEANRHIPSIMSFPKSGMWKLEAYIGGKLFGSVFVKVHEE